MSAQQRAAQGLWDHLAGLPGVVVVTPDSPIRTTVLAVAAAALTQAGVLGRFLAEQLERLDTLSMCLPVPGLGHLILMSRAAMATPVGGVSTLSHEVCHRDQGEREGATRNALDYVLSPEMRAAREAEAYVVGLWTRYLLTGELPEARGALASLSGDTYHLAAADIDLARGIIASHLETIRRGVCPPIGTALTVLRYLQAHHPEAIMPAAHRAAPGES